MKMGFFKKIEDHLVAPKAETNLQLDDPYVVLGDNLEGTFTVSPHEDIQATEIRCEIKCTETSKTMRMQYNAAMKTTVAAPVTEKKTLYEAKPPCNPATELVNGITKAFRFSINIPAGARPTFMSTDDSVVWEIKGVVAVHGRPDVTTKEQVIQVIPQSERPASEPPKMRLVQCQYCQAEMPEGALACPNCGAKRTTS